LLISACSYNRPVNEKNTDVIKPILLGQNASLDNILLNEGNSVDFTDIDPDENVWAIVEIKGDSLIDYYLKQNQYSTFPEFVTMSHELISTINNEQNEIKAIISDVMDNVIYKHTYNALFNGFSLNIKYSQINELKKLSDVKSVTITDDYYLYNKFRK
jgi:Peptidase inhibitor I9.